MKDLLELLVGYDVPVHNQLALKYAIEDKLEAQRQSDLKKISFHAGIDLKTLQGYLDSSIEPNKETEQD